MKIEVGDVWRDPKSSNPSLYFVSNTYGLDEHETIEVVDLRNGGISEEYVESLTQLVFRRGVINRLSWYEFK
jgi:hypothetical protein